MCGLIFFHQLLVYCNGTVLCVEFIVVKATVDIVQWYCVVRSFFVVITTIFSVQCYCVVCEAYCGYCNSRYIAMVLCCLESFVVTSTVELVHRYYVLCVVYFGYTNCIYSAKVQCFVWSLLWLNLQYI